MGFLKARADNYIGKNMNKLIGIIITGTSGSGKKTIAEELQKKDSKYDHIKELTTRKKFEDNTNHYLYINEKEYEKRRATFFSYDSYCDEKYAYSVNAIENACDKNRFSILVISPETFSLIKGEEKREGIKNLERYISFFVDSSDDELNIRLENRDGIINCEEEKNKRENDRKYSDIPDYIIQNHNLSDTVRIIDRLLELYETSTKLSEQDIDLYIRNGMLVTNEDKNNIKGASYDLRLGDEFYYRGEIKKLEDQNLRLTIEPYDYALVSSKEEISLPKDVVAHFGLTVGLFCQGIILSNGQQVDPGFRGKLFCLLFNTSNQSVTIKRGAHYATIEFTKMNKLASKYKGKYQEKREIIDVLPVNAMQGGLSELKKEIEELKLESRNMQSLYISVITIIFAAISILLIIK